MGVRPPIEGPRGGVVLLEDLGAEIGLFLALAGLVLTRITGEPPG